MKTIDGHELAKSIYQEVSLSPKKFILGVILPNDDEASARYVKLKTEKCNSLGIDTIVFKPNLEAENLTELITERINEWNSVNSVSGILIQLPLDSKLDRDSILNLIDPKKDVDGLTSYNLENILNGKEYYFSPATVNAVLVSIDFVAKDLNLSREEYLKDKKVVIVNDSNLIGKPLNALLSKSVKEVINLNEFSKDTNEQVLNADIVVTATGKGHLFSSENFKKNAVVIDITSIKKDDSVIGDVLTDEKLKEKISYLTPVPGGIGPLTVACLIQNLLKTQKNG